MRKSNSIPQQSKKKAAMAAAPPVWWRRRRPMRAFFGVLMACGFILMAYPYLPLLTYMIAPRAVERLPYATRLDDTAHASALTLKLPTAGTKTPEGKRLVIPSIGVDMAVVEGSNESALLAGAWRIPHTGASPEDGNMVLSGHRFRYRPPSSETLYLLDQVREGDVIIVYWDGKEYDYTVTETKIVEATAIEILDPSPSPMLTVFTCTPLFSTSKRLVVTAQPIIEN